MPIRMYAGSDALFLRAYGQRNAAAQEAKRLETAKRA